MNGGRAAAGVGVSGAGLVVVWLAGHAGIPMSAELGYVLGVGALAAFGAIARHGLIGLGRIVLFGRRPGG